MKSKRLCVRSALALLGLGLAAAVAPAQATVVPRFDAGALADQSALVFIGTVVDHQAAVTRDGIYPYTFVTFDVEDVLKGKADLQITLRFDGGPVGNEFVEVAGMPRFEVGGRHLLFVAGAEQGFCPLAGWFQGKFDFVRHPEDGRDVLVDYKGHPVKGVSKDRFVRSEAKLTGKPEPKKVQLLKENNVKITFAADEAVATSEEIAAENAVEQIKSWLRERKPGKGAVAASRVRSARPEEVPLKAPVMGGGVK